MSIRANAKIFITLLILLNVTAASASIDARQFFGMIERGDVAGVKLAILDGFEINRVYSEGAATPGITPLLGAIRHNRPRVVRLLLESGANAEMKGMRDATPLLTSILWSEIYRAPGKYSERDKRDAGEIFDALLEHGTDVNYNGTYGGGGERVTPLGFAVSLGDYALSAELTGKLLRAGADANHDRKPGELSPLILALTSIFTRWEEKGPDIYGNRADLIKLLLDSGADPNAVCDGYSALHVTAMYDYDLTKMLLDSGADKRAKSAEGITPLGIAIKNSQITIARLPLAY